MLHLLLQLVSYCYCWVQKWRFLTKNSSLNSELLNSILLKAFGLCYMSPTNIFGSVQSYGNNC